MTVTLYIHSTYPHPIDKHRKITSSLTVIKFLSISNVLILQNHPIRALDIFDKEFWLPISRVHVLKSHSNDS